ncbi:CinA family protein, partial [Candidatus Omnitrophota bacterium]
MSIASVSIHDLFIQKKISLAVAESCTGGLLASLLTQLPGSSKYFTLGVVTYSNNAKSSCLGITPGTIKKHGAVSREVARRMASSVRRIAAADFAIGITGIAGPSGG